MNYVDIIEKNIYNIDSKICGIIDDYKILHDSQKVADYVIQFLRTYLETIAARIYAYENPDKPTPIRGKDKWYTQYIKALKETNEYGYIWMFHHSLQIVTSHYVPAAKTVEELRLEYPNEDLSILLKKRDNEWIDSAKGQLKGNLQRFSRKLEDKRASNKPGELIERALSALQAVDCEQDSFTKDPHIEEMVREINKLTYEMKKILERR